MLRETAWIEPLGWMLVHSVWLIGLVVAVAAVALLALRRHSAEARYWVGAVALLLSALALPAAFVWELLQPQPNTEPKPELKAESILSRVVERPHDVVVEADDAPTNAAEKQVPAPLLADVGRRAFELPVSPAENVTERTQASNGPVAENTSSIVEERTAREQIEAMLRPRLPLIVGSWLLGVCLLSLRPLIGWRSSWQLKTTGLSEVDESLRAVLRRLVDRLGVHAAVRLFESSLVQVPCVVGVLKPVILLPLSAINGLTMEQLEAVLAHELAHVRRHDLLFNVLQTLIETLLFYHPAIWWLSGRVRQEREHCCDDMAIRVCGDAASYARMLVSVEGLRASVPQASLAASGGSLVQRIRRLLPASEESSRSPWLALSGTVLTCLLLASAAHSWPLQDGRSDTHSDAVSENVGQDAPPPESEPATQEANPQPELAQENRERVLAQIRDEGHAALARADYAAMERAYQSLVTKEIATPEDAMWLGHAQHLQGRKKDAALSYLLMLTLADQRIEALQKQTEPTAQQLPSEDERKFGGPVRNWKLERDRELERFAELWPQWVLLAGQVQLFDLDDAADAAKTLARGLRFVPEAESMEKLLADAQTAVKTKPQPPGKKHYWRTWLYPMATQRSLALAYEKLGDAEAAARCWCRFQLSHLAYQVGMADAKAEVVVAAINRVPEDKREPFHEFVLKHPGRPKAPPREFDIPQRLKAEANNPFEVRSRLDGFEMPNFGPSRPAVLKLKNGSWLMSFTGGDVFQARVMFSRSTDGKNWEAPYAFTQNGIFPTRSPAVIEDDDGTLWMVCSSQRLDPNRYSSGGYQWWVCSSQDGKEWSTLKPLLATDSRVGQARDGAGNGREQSAKGSSNKPSDQDSSRALAHQREAGAGGAGHDGLMGRREPGSRAVVAALQDDGHSRDGAGQTEGSLVPPYAKPFGTQYQHTAQLTRDRKGKFWVFINDHAGSTERMADVPLMQPMSLGLEKDEHISNSFAGFDAENRCHLVVTTVNDMWLTSSSDMQRWQTKQVILRRDKTTWFDRPRLVLDGERFVLFYQSGWEQFRTGRVVANEAPNDGPAPSARPHEWGHYKQAVSYELSKPVSIGLEAGASLITRDGDELLLVANQGYANSPPVLLAAKVAALNAIVMTERPMSAATVAEDERVQELLQQLKSEDQKLRATAVVDLGQLKEKAAGAAKELVP